MERLGILLLRSQSAGDLALSLKKGLGRCALIRFGDHRGISDRGPIGRSLVDFFQHRYPPPTQHRGALP